MRAEHHYRRDADDQREERDGDERRRKSHPSNPIGVERELLPTWNIVWSQTIEEGGAAVRPTSARRSVVSADDGNRPPYRDEHPQGQRPCRDCLLDAFSAPFWRQKKKSMARSFG
ncbi:hypothetical protein CDAR_48591 [Caerostris darwini]|uniref:Uncharacterized protein n=1 Tax=Caerostris darwini TaxID=1538125 RepID=A0AAV4NK82_9ARAC|nr:hypothetical protein CDAR_48591 [Caerostris darwini]